MANKYAIETPNPGFNGRRMALDRVVLFNDGKAEVEGKKYAEALVKKGYFCEALGNPKPTETPEDAGDATDTNPNPDEIPNPDDGPKADDDTGQEETE